MISIAEDIITSIEPIESTNNYVYDLSIPDTHMFFANDILVHNTDSIFLHLDPVLRAILADEYDVTSDDEKVEIVLKIIRRVAEFINKHAMKQMLALHNTPSDKSLASIYDFRFKEELVIKRSIFLDAKKKYAIWAIQKEQEKVDNLNVVGMEVVRSDYPRFTKNMMRDLLDKILKQNISKSKMLRAIDLYIEEYTKLLSEGSIDTAIPCIWNMRTYKVEPIAVRGMMVYNAIYGNVFKPGDKGYRFKLSNILVNKLDTTQRNNLNKLKDEGRLKEYDIIVIPEHVTLDTDLLIPDISGMLEYAIYNRLEPILDLFHIDVKNTSDVGW